MAFLPLPSVWKIMKDSPNHILENIIGYDHTSRKIYEDVISLYYWFLLLFQPIWSNSFGDSNLPVNGPKSVTQYMPFAQRLL